MNTRESFVRSLRAIVRIQRTLSVCIDLQTHFDRIERLKQNGLSPRGTCAQCEWREKECNGNEKSRIAFFCVSLQISLRRCHLRSRLRRWSQRPPHCYLGAREPFAIAISLEF